VAGEAVAAATDRDEQILGARKLDRAHDVFVVAATRDNSGMEIDDVIPHPARFFIARIVGQNCHAVEVRREFSNIGNHKQRFDELRGRFVQLRLRRERTGGFSGLR
jgi:hypothetical protein